MDPAAFQEVVEGLVTGNDGKAARVVAETFPFTPMVRQSRNFSDRQKLALFFRDGFIDRYSGDRLVNPGLLRALSTLMPQHFPYHRNWKTDACHPAYWALYPTYDHVIPIAQGGEDTLENTVTTSQLTNSAKGHWRVEELGWTVHEPGEFREWDGLSSAFLSLVDAREELATARAVTQWARLTRELVSASSSRLPL